MSEIKEISTSLLLAFKCTLVRHKVSSTGWTQTILLYASLSDE